MGRAPHGAHPRAHTNIYDYGAGPPGESEHLPQRCSHTSAGRRKSAANQRQHNKWKILPSGNEGAPSHGRRPAQLATACHPSTEPPAVAPPGAGPELLHDGLPLLLWHVPVHRRHGEVGFSHLLRQPVDLQIELAHVTVSPDTRPGPRHSVSPCPERSPTVTGRVEHSAVPGGRWGRSP